MRGREAINACDETKVHGTQFNCLWSILAQGGLVGTYYRDAGIESYAVWTSELPAESIGYSNWVYIGSGFWLTVVVHVSDRDVEESGCDIVRKLGGSKKQVAHKVPFLPICGVSFRVADFDRMCEKYGGGLVNFPHLSKEIKPGQWTESHSWHPLFEVSPIDLKTLVARGLMISNSELSVPLKIRTAGSRDDDMEEDEPVPAAAASASAPSAAAPAAPIPKDLPYGVPSIRRSRQQGNAPSQSAHSVRSELWGGVGEMGVHHEEHPYPCISGSSHEAGLERIQMVCPSHENKLR